MVHRIGESLFGNRKRSLSILLGLALLAGLIVSLSSGGKAQADYYTGCNYGYAYNGTGFGSGSGIAYGYGYVGNHFAYGYGNQVCPMAVTTSSLNGGTVGSAYSQTLTGSGGTGTYNWSSSGYLYGLTLSNGGTLSGTPTTSGSSSVTFTEQDGNGATASRALTLTVAAASSGGGGGGTTPTSTTTTTTPVTTTTTVTSPPIPPVHIYTGKVIGAAKPGESAVLTITGSGFYGDPKITSNEPGTRVLVLHDHGTSLVIRIIVPLGSKTGEHILTIRFADGKTVKANYSVS
jgi:hypothetical protein